MKPRAFIGIGIVAAFFAALTIASDPAGDQNSAPANAQMDITGLSVAEPYPSPAGTSSLIFTVSVDGLDSATALQPNAEWKVAFSVPDTSGVSRTVFVEADTNDPTQPFGEFSYGYTSGTTDFGQGNAGITGTFDTKNSQIVIIVDTSKPFAFTPGVGSTEPLSPWRMLATKPSPLVTI